MIENEKQVEDGKKANGVKRFFSKIGETSFFRWCAKIWKNFKEKHPTLAQFFVFFMISNGVTVLQLVLMPAFRAAFASTELINTTFQFLKLGTVDGDPYYLFDFAAGPFSQGGDGGLAFFLAVQITIGIAQVINFFAQRNITFKSNTNPWYAALWYLIAYIGITVFAAFALTIYRDFVYNLLMVTWGLGQAGETTADVIVMIINSTISFWVFFPIFKVIFRVKKEELT